MLPGIVYAKDPSVAVHYSNLLTPVGMLACLRCLSASTECCLQKVFRRSDVPWYFYVFMYVQQHCCKSHLVFGCRAIEIKTKKSKQQLVGFERRQNQAG